MPGITQNETTLTAAAVAGDFDPVFPDLRGLPKNADRVPGRDLANLVATGLQSEGFDVEGPTNEEPFFAVVCSSGGVQFEILCFIYVPDGRNSLWQVHCQRNLGWFSRLLGKSEEDELVDVVLAIHKVLTTSPRVGAVRWYKEEVPFDGMEHKSGKKHPIQSV